MSGGENYRRRGSIPAAESWKRYDNLIFPDNQIPGQYAFVNIMYVNDRNERKGKCQSQKYFPFNFIHKGINLHIINAYEIFKWISCMVQKYNI